MVKRSHRLPSAGHWRELRGGEVGKESGREIKIKNKRKNESEKNSKRTVQGDRLYQNISNARRCSSSCYGLCAQRSHPSTHSMSRRTGLIPALQKGQRKRLQMSVQLQGQPLQWLLPRPPSNQKPLFVSGLVTSPPQNQHDWRSISTTAENRSCAVRIKRKWREEHFHSFLFNKKLNAESVRACRWNDWTHFLMAKQTEIHQDERLQSDMFISFIYLF